eukprot:4081405-Pyramimonas_sp.AAC.1
MADIMAFTAVTGRGYRTRTSPLLHSSLERPRSVPERSAGAAAPGPQRFSLHPRPSLSSP